VTISRTRISSSGGRSSRFIAVQISVAVTCDALKFEFTGHSASRLKHIDTTYVLSIILCPYLIDQVISPWGVRTQSLSTSMVSANLPRAFPAAALVDVRPAVLLAGPKFNVACFVLADAWAALLASALLPAF